MDSPPKESKKRGRPKGSKNKPKEGVGAVAALAAADGTVSNIQISHTAAKAEPARKAAKSNAA